MREEADVTAQNPALDQRFTEQKSTRGFLSSRNASAILTASPESGRNAPDGRTENDCMDQSKLGHFIFELRKEQNMTQRELAEKLNITDKAVSKWERGLSCPDISLLSALADTLHTTTGELLNGERAATPENEAVVSNVLEYAADASKRQAHQYRRLALAAFTALCLIGILVCAICNLAINGRFTWSLLPISAIVFAWPIAAPMLTGGAKNLKWSLALLTILITPFLWVLYLLLPKQTMLLPIGIPMAVIGIALTWVVYVIFQRVHRKLLAWALVLLVCIPANFLTNAVLNRLVGEPLINAWDAMTLGFLLLIAAGLYLLDRRRSE
jgi:transcriptional regulator with XRE-family HTH domain